MKNLVSNVVISLLAIYQISWAQSSNTTTQKANSLIKEYVQLKTALGASAAVYKEGKLVWKGGAGYLNPARQKPVNSEMLHRTASITKSMTAVAVMQLYEQNKLRLNDPIQKYLPWFPTKKKGTITVKHLLQNSSGIKAYKNRTEARNQKNFPTLRDAIDVFKDRELAHKPGTSFRYTTYGYVVLGAIIESVSGMRYRDYMKKNVWDKAGMSHTDVEIYGKKYANKPGLYKKNAKGQFVKDDDTNLSLKIPGGGVQSTAEDLVKFGQAVLDNKLIKASTLDLMMQDPKLPNTWLFPYGMGLFLAGGKDQPSGRIIGHSGSQSGTSTQLFIFLDKKVVVSVMVNTGKVWLAASTLASELAELVIDAPIKTTEESLWKIIHTRGSKAGIQWLKAQQSKGVSFNERQVNNLGYYLLRRGQIRPAIELFKLYVHMFPKSWNAQDGLGEAYLAAGNKTLAIQHYQKSVEMNPKNTEGMKVLEKLRNK
ncbi:hypothetical protein BKI52_11210 [marine bacterium AO1-C]|nr:hypothetical protein BKI52_11210 [marine bacterium AO1-C]